MQLFETGRWPPLTDAESLKEIIRSITDDELKFESKFFQEPTPLNDEPCQGDIVELRCAVPFIDEDGQAVVTDHEFQHWIVLGNTCDMSRSEEKKSLIAPLVQLQAEVTPERIQRFRKYELYKQFYVPPWADDPEQLHRAADFMQLVTIEKAAFHKSAKIVARLQFPAWALLHACIVRYLARDDGRFD